MKSLGCFGELVLLPSLGGLGEVSSVSVNSSCCRLLAVLVKSLVCFGELVLLPSLGGLGEVSWLFR